MLTRMLVVRTVRRPDSCIQTASRLLSISSPASSRTNTDKLNVDFYFDTVSPYSWPAFEVMIRYRQLWNLTINYKPVFMGGLTWGASKRNDLKA